MQKIQSLLSGIISKIKPHLGKNQGGIGSKKEAICKGIGNRLKKLTKEETKVMTDLALLQRNLRTFAESIETAKRKISADSYYDVVRELEAANESLSTFKRVARKLIRDT